MKVKILIKLGMSFWQNVENELIYKNISRKELAEKASFAVSGISLGLAHNSIPNADVAVRIAEVLDVSTEYLVTGKEKNISSKENAALIQHIVSDMKKLSQYDLETLAILAKRMAKD
ncbi:MAG: helix-turn-helix domain-containing protein [Treponema sp.]|uniref:helix-turn-helix domain-containing protein n=1 Tax=uncultured Treponema sp. TaxID=162155 RepID=UPI00261ABF6B|nr:helix-turn-helix domain-containing protein [uncultured Treponema sp.]MBQ8013251.1 helix-turn-helix domain-containing protein [Treponema sp.]